MSEVTRRSVPPAQRWTLPSIEGEILGARRPQAPEDSLARAKAAAAEKALVQAAAQLDAEKAQKAQEEARERGHSEGLKAAEKEMQPKLARLDAQAQHLDAIINSLASPLADLDEQVPQQLARLAMAVGQQLARRELSIYPDQLVVLIREAVGRLPVATHEVRVHLNPGDAVTVRERLATPAQERAWILVEDPTLSPGGCLVRGDGSQIDARFESRLNAITTELFDETRSHDRALAAAEAADAAAAAEAAAAEAAEAAAAAVAAEAEAEAEASEIPAGPEAATEPALAPAVDETMSSTTAEDAA